MAKPMVRKKVMGKERRSKILDMWKEWRLIAYSNPAILPSPQNSEYKMLGWIDYA
jgi:hypothetical protein